MSAIENVRALIENQLEAIEREVVALHDARKTLEREAQARTPRSDRRTGASAATAGRKSATRRATARKRSAGIVDLRELEELLGKSSAGLSATEVAKQTDASPEQIRALLKDLETRGRVRRTGQRRGTRWRVVTDEDWIAERAAELEARSARAAIARDAA